MIPGMEFTWTPRRQGDAGELSAMNWLTYAGAIVCKPLFESRDYDLVADFGDSLARVQVKTSSCWRNGRWEVTLATRGGNQSWSGLVKRLDVTRCDALFVHVGDGRRWYIPAAALGARIETGVAGGIVIVMLAAGFGVAYAGFGLLVALKTRNVQATQSSFLLFFPLLFLTPNFVPFNRLSPLMETLARINPVSYVIVGMRGLVIDGWNLGQIAVAVLVIVGLGAILTGLSLRVIATYDR